jgi:hypothetical protein
MEKYQTGNKLTVPFHYADYLIVLNRFIIYKLNMDRKLEAVQNSAALLDRVVVVVVVVLLYFE